MSAPTATQVALERRVETRRLGRWTIHAIQAGGQKLDGGAMFGVVQKVLWQRRITPDDRNRIQLGMRCILIEHEIGRPVELRRQLREPVRQRRAQSSSGHA